MGIFDSLFESEQETESKSSFAPWGPAAPGLQSLAGALSRMASTPLEFFPGQTYAPQTEAEQLAISSLMEQAGAFPGGIGDAFTSALAAPNVAENPYVQGMAGALETQVNRNLMENILPAISRGEVMGPSGAVARGIAGRGTQEALTSGLANLYGSAYGQGLQAQQAALGMAPSITGLQAGLYGQAGAMERQEAQRAIDEEMQRFQFEQTEPYQRAQYAQPLIGLGQTYGTGTERLKGTSTISPFQQIGGMALGLGTLAGGLGGLGFLGGGGAAGGLGGQPWGGGYSPGGFPVIGPRR